MAIVTPAQAPLTPPHIFLSFGRQRFRQLSSASVRRNSSSGKDLAVFLEVDGILADIHKHGHRQSFNVAFQNLGLDCANWTEPVYLDLLRQGNSEKEMLTAFFNKIGWPTSLPTSEKDAFINKVMQLKQTELERIAASEALPIRSDLTCFLDEAIRELVPLVFLISYSKCGERVSRILLEKLGNERLMNIKIVGSEEVQNSDYGQVVLGLGVSSSPDELLASELAKAVSSKKQQLAEEVASTLKLRVDINTTSTSQLKTTIAALRAAAEISEMPLDRCLLLAGAYIGVEAASRIGSPCIVVRSSLTARAEFPLARAVLDGFGSGAVTLNRLRSYLE